MMLCDSALYFDHSATTPPCAEAIAAMQSALQEHWGNPSSLHGWGQRATLVIEQARLQIAALISAPAEQLIFTSGGTEASNLALFGVARRYTTPQHLIISAVEHAAVAQAAQQLSREGWAVSILPVDLAGRVTVETLEAYLRANTVLVSVIHGQSEVGTIQPIQALAARCRAAGVLFHSDAVQTVGRIPVAVGDCDLLSCASHKLYGPQGVGVLYSRVPLAPQVVGGSQEAGLRAGTQAVAAIAGFGAAAARAQASLELEQAQLRTLQGQLHTGLSDFASLQLTGEPNFAQRLPHHLSYCVQAQIGNRIVQCLSQRGLAISAGSACASGTLQPSPVLLAMGYEPEAALGAIRISCGRSTTPDAIAQLIDAIATFLGR